MAELKVEIPEFKSKADSALLGKLLIRAIKQDIFERFIKSDTLSAEDQEFCDKIDWYPVDWLPLKKSFIKKLKKIEKGPHSKPMSLAEFNKWCDEL